MSINHIVVDSGAIIKGHAFSFYKTESKLWTVAEVINEIRDSKSRDILSTLPFELEIRSPSEKAMLAVSSFTRKTGDFTALSLCDLKVLALTYDIEVENNGVEHIRDAPAVSRII
jgi:RNA-binding protein NOB1